MMMMMTMNTTSSSSSPDAQATEIGRMPVIRHVSMQSCRILLHYNYGLSGFSGRDAAILCGRPPAAADIFQILQSWNWQLEFLVQT